MQRPPLKVHDENGIPHFGIYEGALNSCSLQGVKGEKRPYRRKKWQYQVIVTPEVIVLYAMVDLNYASSAFLTALDLSTGSVLDESFLGLPILTKVSISDEPAEKLKASFHGKGVSLQVQGDSEGLRLKAYQKGFALDARVSSDFSRALTVIAPVAGGIVNVTQKLIASEVRGSLSFKGRTFDLGLGMAGLDYTQGYLARRTCWRWAMGMGRLPDGRAFGFNLVEGINESPVTSENSFWVGGKLHSLGKAEFEWNAYDLMKTWKIKTQDGKVQLTFTPKFIHHEAKDLGLIKSSFAQPVGLFSGTVELDGESFSFRDIGGVTEFQDSTW